MTSDESRREFLIRKLAAGFAAAVLPAGAAIKTDSVGLVAGDIEIPANDVRIPGYAARPVAGTGFPIVLVVHEVFGVHEHIKDICRRLAKTGYLAVAPSLFTRQGDPARVADVRKLMSDIVAKTPDAQVMSDLDATVSWAEKDSGDAERLGLTGFCWGGRIAWLYAAHSSKLSAAAAWYGRVTGTRTALQPKNPIDVVEDLKAPVIGFYGGRDESIPADSVQQMREAVINANKIGIINIFPDAQQGFNADYRPTYNEYAAMQAWTKMLNFFHQNAVAA